MTTELRSVLRVVVASANPVKLEATRGAFERAFPETRIELAGVAVPSGVSDQPMSDEETLRGARNRAAAAEGERPEAEYWVGLEGGVAPAPIEEAADGAVADRREPDLLTFAWVVVRGRAGADTREIRQGSSRTAAFVLPPEVSRLVHSGMELGEADDRVFGRVNSKQKQGAAGLVTRGLIDRTGLYGPSVILALVPFLRPDLYPD